MAPESQQNEEPDEPQRREEHRETREERSTRELTDRRKQNSNAETLREMKSFERYWAVFIWVESLALLLSRTCPKSSDFKSLSSFGINLERLKHFLFFVSDFGF